MRAAVYVALRASQDKFMTKPRPLEK